MNGAVEFLFAGAQATAEAFLEPAGFELLPEAVPFVGGGKGRDDAVEEIQVQREIIGGLEFDSADVRRGGDRRSLAGKMRVLVTAAWRV